MSLGLEFEKYQGAGNHFVLFDRPWTPEFSPERLRFICAPAFGVGADGVLFVDPPRDAAAATARMRMFNPDGSEAEMCGNGIRCFALHLMRTGRAAGESVKIETLAGLHDCRILRDADGNFSGAEIAMGRPAFGINAAGVDPSAPDGAWGFDLGREHEGRRLIGYAVSMGNPHLVIFDEGGEEACLRHGPLLEHHPAFPGRVNVEFVKALSENEFRVDVWERGAGRTLACGSGSCAVACAAVKLGKADPGKPVRIVLPGGTLQIRTDAGLDRVFLSGPAEHVFSGRSAG